MGREISQYPHYYRLHTTVVPGKNLGSHVGRQGVGIEEDQVGVESCAYAPDAGLQTRSGRGLLKVETVWLGRGMRCSRGVRPLFTSRPKSLAQLTVAALTMELAGSTLDLLRFSGVDIGVEGKAALGGLCDHLSSLTIWINKDKTPFLNPHPPPFHLRT